jgi:hypothetical protein
VISGDAPRNGGPNGHRFNLIWRVTVSEFNEEELIRRLVANVATFRWRAAVQDLKELFQFPGPHLDLGELRPLLIGPDRSRQPVDVVLDPAAQGIIAPRWNRPGPERSDIILLLAVADGGDGKHIELYTRTARSPRSHGRFGPPDAIDEDRVGALTAADSADYLTIIAAAHAAGKFPAAAQAKRDRDAQGGWALHLYRPDPLRTGPMPS